MSKPSWRVLASSSGDSPRPLIVTWVPATELFNYASTICLNSIMSMVSIYREGSLPEIGSDYPDLTWLPNIASSSSCHANSQDRSTFCLLVPIDLTLRYSEIDLYCPTCTASNQSLYIGYSLQIFTNGTFLIQRSAVYWKRSELLSSTRHAYSQLSCIKGHCGLKSEVSELCSALLVLLNLCLTQDAVESSSYPYWETLSDDGWEYTGSQP